MRSEQDLLGDAEQRARTYLNGVNERRVFPDQHAVAGLNAFDEDLQAIGCDPASTLKLLDECGSPATVASNGPNYFGFVIGATLPVADAVERLTLAWDQCASSFDNSPTADKIEKVAAAWILDILALPANSAVSFGTSASACGLICFAAARQKILKYCGWDIERQGLQGAPQVRVVVSEKVHITIVKALRILGFGTDNIYRTPVDEHGRIDPSQLLTLDQNTILCLQAGEVNTGEFDPIDELIKRANDAGSWVHIDGAFGLWARASQSKSALAKGVEGADS